MNKLPPKQRLQIAQIYFEKHSSIQEIHQAIHAVYGVHNGPSKRLIQETMDRFHNTFALNNNRHIFTTND